MNQGKRERERQRKMQGGTERKKFRGEEREERWKERERRRREREHSSFIKQHADWFKSLVNLGAEGWVRQRGALS